MSRTKNTHPILVIASLLAAGCAGSGDRYPSLAVRDVERNPVQETPAPPVEPVELPIRSMAPSTPVDTLVEQASAAFTAFEGEAPAVRALVSSARGASVESDAYGRAILALADLTSHRSKSEIALADLDLMLAENANRFEDTAVILAAHKLVLDMVNEQNQTLNTLWENLRR